MQYEKSHKLIVTTMSDNIQNILQVW